MAEETIMGLALQYCVMQLRPNDGINLTLTADIGRQLDDGAIVFSFSSARAASARPTAPGIVASRCRLRSLITCGYCLCIIIV